MRVLVAAQLLGALGLAAGAAAGALLAEHLTGSAAAAGLPLAALVLGSGVGAVAVTRVMDRAGRRVRLAAAHPSGALGAGVAVAAAALPDWRLLLAGCVLLGGGNAAVLLALLRPDPLQVARQAAGPPAGGQQGTAGGGAGLASMFGDRHLRLAVLALAVTNLTMVAVMAVVPVHLHARLAAGGLALVGPVAAAPCLLLLLLVLVGRDGRAGTVR
jgi:MFS family permease